MTTYTITLDLIKNIKPEEIVSVLYRLINEECSDCIAIDDEMKLLKNYYKYSPYPDFISSWIKLMTYRQCYISVRYTISSDEFSDKDILLMTNELLGDKKMVVHSIQSVKEYGTIEVKYGKNHAMLVDVCVPVISCREAKIALNTMVNNTNNISESIMAFDHAEINRSTIKE